MFTFNKKILSICLAILTKICDIPHSCGKNLLNRSLGGSLPHPISLFPQFIRKFGGGWLRTQIVRNMNGSLGARRCLLYSCRGVIRFYHCLEPPILNLCYSGEKSITLFYKLSSRIFDFLKLLTSLGTWNTTNHNMFLVIIWPYASETSWNVDFKLYTVYTQSKSAALIIRFSTKYEYILFTIYEFVKRMYCVTKHYQTVSVTHW